MMKPSVDCFGVHCTFFTLVYQEKRISFNANCSINFIGQKPECDEQNEWKREIMKTTAYISRERLRGEYKILSIYFLLALSYLFCNLMSNKCDPTRTSVDFNSQYPIIFSRSCNIKTISINHFFNFLHFDDIHI